MREHNRVIVKSIRDETVCEKCGGQPIEWHHDEHPQHPELRIANLVDDGKPLDAIRAEIARCEALCRRCHMAADGRSRRLARSGGRRHGEANGRAKLTAELVAELRRAFAADPSHGAQTRLARQYGIPITTVNHVVRGRTWTA